MVIYYMTFSFHCVCSFLKMIGDVNNFNINQVCRACCPNLSALSFTQKNSANFFNYSKSFCHIPPVSNSVSCVSSKSAVGILKNAVVAYLKNIDS